MMLSFRWPHVSLVLGPAHDSRLQPVGRMGELHAEDERRSHELRHVQYGCPSRMSLVMQRLRQIPTTNVDISALVLLDLEDRAECHREQS